MWSHSSPSAQVRRRTEPVLLSTDGPERTRPDTRTQTWKACWGSSRRSASSHPAAWWNDGPHAGNRAAAARATRPTATARTGRSRAIADKTTSRRRNQAEADLCRDWIANRRRVESSTADQGDPCSSRVPPVCGVAFDKDLAAVAPCWWTRAISSTRRPPASPSPRPAPTDPNGAVTTPSTPPPRRPSPARNPAGGAFSPPDPRHHRDGIICKIKDGQHLTCLSARALRPRRRPGPWRRCW